MRKWLWAFAIGLILATPVEAFWQSRDSNYNVSFPSSGGGCSQATAFLGRVTTTYTTAYTTMICGMVTDGTWSSFDVLYIFATDSSANALTNLISSSFTATVTGAPTFTANSGYVGNGTTSTINTGYNYNTNHTNYTQNSATIMAWATGGATNDNGCPIGASSLAGDINLQPLNFASQIGGFVNGGTNMAVSTATQTGLTALDRSTSILVTAYRNGSSVGVASSTSGAVTSETAQGLECAGGQFFAENVGMIGVAGDLGVTGESSVYSRIHTFLHTVNASLYP